jgi:poly-gamma-glutamate synthesis protein (capsule biosynthesis protein)
MRKGNLSKNELKNNNRNNRNDDESVIFNNNNKKYTKNKKSTKKQIIIMLIWFVIMIFIVFQIYRLISYTLGKTDKEKLWLYNSVSSVIGVFVSKTPITTSEDFSFKFAGIGDIYATTNIISGAKTTNGYNFLVGTEKVEEILKKYDLVTASLNTPVADKSLGFTSKTIYNSPIEILEMLEKLNVSVIATATNHAMDKNSKGIEQTIENIESTDLKQIGINKEKRQEPIVISKNQINIGILSYATSSNVKITKGKEYLVNTLDEYVLKEDISNLKSKNVDYIIAYLNIPNEESLMTNSEQKENVEMLFKNGVNVVLGTGSMVIQDSIEDSIENNGKQEFIYGVYSLGDFMGGYQSTDKQLSIIADIEFTKKQVKNKKGEIVEVVKDIKINKPIALWTEVDKKYQKTIYVLDDIIKEFEDGNSNFSAKEYNVLKEAQTRITQNFK